MKWKEYKVSEVFEQYRGKEASPNRVPDGKINMVNEISSNNGVAKKGASENIFKAPAITVSVNFAQNVFVQEEDFCASVNILILKAKWMELYPKTALYLATLLRKNNVRYNYSCKFSKDRLNDTVIKLPVKTTYKPDFELLSEIIGGGISMNNIDTSSWRKFRLADIAELNNGNKMDKNKMSYINPTINFVSRTSFNNGISDVVDKIDLIEPYPAGCITLAFGGSVGSCFLQDKPFYTGQNVGVISFPDDVTREAKLFIVSALEKKCKSSFHAFGNEINKHFKTDLSIKLPVKETEEIDWEYMEKYIAELEQERIAELEQYLIAAGLNNYELTDEDKEVLEMFRKVV